MTDGISWVVFIAPMTGVLVTDFWIVRRQHWKIPDLFREDGIYWYTWGLNWRAFLCFFLACIPSMREFPTPILPGFKSLLISTVHYIHKLGLWLAKNKNFHSWLRLRCKRRPDRYRLDTHLSAIILRRLGNRLSRILYSLPTFPPTRLTDYGVHGRRTHRR